MDQLEQWFQQKLEQLKKKQAHELKKFGFIMIPSHNHLLDPTKTYVQCKEASQFVSESIDRKTCVMRPKKMDEEEVYLCFTHEKGIYIEIQLAIGEQKNIRISSHVLNEERIPMRGGDTHKKISLSMEEAFLNWLAQNPAYRLLAVTGSLTFKGKTLTDYL